MQMTLLTPNHWKYLDKEVNNIHMALLHVDLWFKRNKLNLNALKQNT